MSTSPAASARRGGETLAAALLALSALLFGTVVLFGKFALRARLPVFGFLSVRFAVAAAVVASVLAITRRPLLASPGERLGIAVVGMAGYAVEAAFFFTGLRYGTAAAVTLLFFTYPVFTTLASWLMGRDAPNRLTIGALACAVTGAAVVVSTGGGLAVQTLGVVLALGSAAIYTGYLIGADHVLKRTNALTGAMWQAGAASVGLAALALATGRFALPSGWHEWWPLLGMALATAGAFFCLLEGLQRLGPVRTAIISALEPLVAAVFGTVFLHEPLGWGVAVGGALIVAGVVAASLTRGARVAEPAIP